MSMLLRMTVKSREIGVYTCTPPLIRQVVRTSVNTGWNGGFNPSGIRKVSVRTRQDSVNTRDFECEVVRSPVNTGDCERKG